MPVAPSTLVPPGFSSASAWQGARTGFVFKAGSAGLGYYPDDRKPCAASSSADGEVVVTPAAHTCHYAVLGVARTASAEELKRAYRARALECHPDRHVDDFAAATGRFQVLQAAFAVLSDVVERRWYDQHREAILAGVAPGTSTDPAAPAAASSTAAQEAPGIDLLPYFSPAAYCGFGEDEDAGAAAASSAGPTRASPASFYAVYASVFAQLAEEEAALAERGGGAAGAADGPAAALPPSLGGPATAWEQVDAFYSHWAGFRTARSFGAEMRYSDAAVAKAANRQRRKQMQAENERLLREARRRRDESVRRRGTSDVWRRPIPLSGSAASLLLAPPVPSPHGGRLPQVHALLSFVRKRDPRVAARRAALEAAGAGRPTGKEHAERVRALREEIARLEAEEAEEAEDSAEEGAGDACEEEEENDKQEEVEEEEDDDDDPDAALLRMASASKQVPKQQQQEEEDDDEADEDEPDAALLRMMGAASASQSAAKGRQTAGDDSESSGGEADEKAAARAAQLAAQSAPRGKPKPNPRKKERDPAAAARVAEGMALRRAADGLGCKVCGKTFPTRQLLLKHIEKLGHFRDPNETAGGLPGGLVFIPPAQGKGHLAIT